MNFLDRAIANFGYEIKDIAQQRDGTYRTPKSARQSIVSAQRYSGGFSTFNNQRQQLLAYKDWVYIAVKAVAEQCAAIDLRLFENHTKVNNRTLAQKLIENPIRAKEYMSQRVNYVAKKDGRLTYRKNVAALEELDIHPFLSLLNRPNEHMDKNEFFEMTFLHLELTGNAYWFISRKNGKPDELWPLMPNCIQIVPDEKHFIVGYVYTTDGVQVPLNPEDVVHHRLGNPSDMRYGFSPVMAGATTIDTDFQAGEFNRRFFYNTAVPDGFLTIEDTMDEKTFKRIRSEWDNAYGGSTNAHRTAILSGGMKYEPISVNQRDMEFFKSRQFSRDQIFAFFGVPKSILGYDESMSRSNSDTAERVFMKRNRTRMQRLVNRITMSLADDFAENLIVSFTDPVPQDQDQVLNETTKSLGSTNTVAWRTINEIRAERGLLPVKNGDELFVPNSMRPLTQTQLRPKPEGTPAVVQEDPSEPSQEPDDMEPADKADDPGPSKQPSSSAGDGIADNGSTTSDTTNVNRGGKALPSFPKSKLLIDNERKQTPFLDHKAHNHVPSDTKVESVDDTLSVYRATYAHQQDAFEQRFLQSSKERFNSQKSEVLFSIHSNELVSKSVGSMKSKDIRDVLDNLFDKSKSIVSWVSLLGPIYKGAAHATGNLSIDVLNDPQKYGYDNQKPDKPLTYDNSDVLVQKFLVERPKMISKGIDQETDKQLRATLTEGINAGEKMQSLLDRVEKVYGAASGYRALRIARTESQKTLQYVNERVWDSSGLVEKYIWKTANDPCPKCAPYRNTVKDNQKNYDQLPTVHPLCRCLVMPYKLKNLADINLEDVIL